jgi:hypothetical protein
VFSDVRRLSDLGLVGETRDGQNQAAKTDRALEDGWNPEILDKVKEYLNDAIAHA